MLHDQEAARDTLQEATLLAWRKRDQLRSPGSVRPWFLAIVGNECRALRRTKWWSVVKLPEIVNRSTTPEDKIASATDVEGAIRRLSRSDRLVLFLRFYMDMPFDEVANTLGLSVPAAKARIYRAVERLRPIIGKEEAFS
jgi:RNA polymerase sigma-70 factor (ECF subfamily)